MKKSPFRSSLLNVVCRICSRCPCIPVRTFQVHEDKRNEYCEKTYFCGILVFVLLQVVFSSVTVWAADAKPEKLRVGYFEFAGYHMVDAQGNRSGYGYDILQLIRPYLNCQYEYVGYDKGWSEMLPMLERGEIDFVTSAVRTPEKLKKFDFTDISIGNSSVIMTVKSGHSRYHRKDYAHWNGIRVGMIPNNSKNEVFAKFAEEKKFTFTPCYYPHAAELSKALQSGKVDALVTGSLRKIDNELIYERIDIQPFYIIVKKGNKELLRKLNNALDDLVMETPGFAGELQQIYYGAWRNNMKGISLSASELAFVRESEEKKREFLVLLQPDRYPLEYLQDGKPQGVFVDIAMLIAKNTGLKFKLVMPSDSAEYYKFCAERRCDIIMDVPHDFQWAEEYGYFLTKPYYPVETTMLSKKNKMGMIRTVGTLKGSILDKIAEENKPKEVAIYPYHSNEALIHAVKTREIDGAYLLEPMVENVLLNDRSGTLTQEKSGRLIDFSVAIRSGLDAQFVSIIAKSVNSLSKQNILDIGQKNNLLLNKKTTFRDWVVENPLSVSLSLIMLVLILGSALSAVLIYHRRAGRAAALLAKNSKMWKLLLDSLPIHV
ncbi:MAG: transporter substrate-binding domain-containing protein, partial [Thermoguttaceae bacterium]|nr:transporter substrate-binding domain-containing protein [Thermoguttaceae bacterium]